MGIIRVTSKERVAAREGNRKEANFVEGRNGCPDILLAPVRAVADFLADVLRHDRSGRVPNGEEATPFRSEEERDMEK